MNPPAPVAGSKPPSRLGELAARRSAAEGHAAARRHERLVAHLKIALPALAVLCLAAIAITLALNAPERAPPPQGKPAIEMTAPVLTGASENGEPYEVRADEAVQNRQGLIAMRNIRARMTLTDGELTLEAPSGEIDPVTGKARVEGGVTVRMNAYTFKAPAAEADMKAAIVTGDQGVDVTGPMGWIRAKTFRIAQSTETAHFEGEVTSEFTPGAFEETKTP